MSMTCRCRRPARSTLERQRHCNMFVTDTALAISVLFLSMRVARERFAVVEGVRLGSDVSHASTGSSIWSGTFDEGEEGRYYPRGSACWGLNRRRAGDRELEDSLFVGRVLGMETGRSNSHDRFFQSDCAIVFPYQAIENASLGQTVGAPVCCRNSDKIVEGFNIWHRLQDVNLELCRQSF